VIGQSGKDPVASDDKERAISFWNEVIANMPDWQRVGTREVSAFEMRQNYVHAHGVAVQAIAAAGAQLIEAYPKDWKTQLTKLRNIDWSRSNRSLWDNRALVAGKVNKSKNNVTLVTNVIVKALGLPLKPEAQRIEELYGTGQGGLLKAAI
jgi:DNA sulfur modification protein DndB